MVPGDLDERVADHVRDMHRRGLGRETISARVRIVTRAAGWLAEREIDLLEAGPEDLARFLDDVDVAPSSRATYTSHLGRFYSWAERSGLVERDPAAAVVRPRARARQPHPAGDVDVAWALERLGGAAGAMVRLAALCGLRCVEIARLTRGMVRDDQARPVLLLEGKGDRPRIVPLHPDAARALGDLPMPRRGPIFHHLDGSPVGAWYVSHTGNEALHRIGVAATMHELRAWYGTNVYRTSGHDLVLVRELLGHSSVATTQGYVAADRAGAAEAVGRLGLELRRIDVPLPLAWEPIARSLF